MFGVKKGAYTGADRDRDGLLKQADGGVLFLGIEKIRQGEKIYNPKLNFIRVNHEEEFIFSMKVAGLIDKKFNIETPGDEIGYIAIFFASNQFMVGEEEDIKIGIIIDMHGRSTASSMVEVVNHLLDTDYVIPCGGA